MRISSGKESRCSPSGTDEELEEEKETARDEGNKDDEDEDVDEEEEAAEDARRQRGEASWPSLCSESASSIMVGGNDVA
jgi:hypothetical protein